jgi:hypothetical protein
VNDSRLLHRQPWVPRRANPPGAVGAGLFRRLAAGLARAELPRRPDARPRAEDPLREASLATTRRSYRVTTALAFALIPRYGVDGAAAESAVGYGAGAALAWALFAGSFASSSSSR